MRGASELQKKLKKSFKLVDIVLYLFKQFCTGTEKTFSWKFHAPFWYWHQKFWSSEIFDIRHYIDGKMEPFSTELVALHDLNCIFQKGRTTP